MRIYISGPMAGLPDHNRAAFDAAEQRLLDQGHFVINPHDLSAQFGPVEEIAKSFRQFYSYPFRHEKVAATDELTNLARCVMSADFAAVRSCDAIYLLRGWENSRGAKKELAEAIQHGLAIMLEGVDA